MCIFECLWEGSGATICDKSVNGLSQSNVELCTRAGLIESSATLSSR